MQKVTGAKVLFTSLVVTCMLTGSAFAADITGKIKYEGAVPQLKPLKMDADPVCQSKHSSPVLPDILVLGDGNSLGNVFVRVKTGPVPATTTTPTTPVIIKQEGCMYKPHVTGVMVNQPVMFQNPDGTLHNVHALPKVNREFNLAMPATKTEAEKSFPKEEFMFEVKCDAHPWMLSYIAVMSHPFFAVTQPDGAFTLKGLPAGTYEVEAWHEKLGTQSATVTLAEGETKTADFTFKR